MPRIKKFTHYKLVWVKTHKRGKKRVGGYLARRKITKKEMKKWTWLGITGDT